ncbi:MAG: hemin-degrading factor [Bacteroidota bacterium]
MNDTVTTSKSEILRSAWRGVQQAKPGIRIREAAALLGASEAELLATTTGEEATRLEGDWQELLKRLPELGRVMSLTRNDGCILEHKGSFQKVNTLGVGARAMGTVIGPIETRVFFSAWHSAYAVNQKKNDRDLISLQVFDQAGHAITKIYLQEKSNIKAFEKLVKDFTSADQGPEQFVKPYAEEKFNEHVSREIFLNDWSALKDTHDFYPMLRKHNVHRHQALLLAERKYSHKLHPAAVEKILHEASALKLPIMIFAGNRGNLQIHQGKIRSVRIIDHGHGGDERWLNIMDPDFNMHLRADHIDTVWLVNKPTTDGEVTSVEVFDKNREMVVQFFGLRKPGIPELEEWKKLASALPRI